MYAEKQVGRRRRILPRHQISYLMVLPEDKATKSDDNSRENEPTRPAARRGRDTCMRGGDAAGWTAYLISIGLQ